MQLVDAGGFVFEISSRIIPLVGSWQLPGEARQQHSSYNVTATRVVQPRGGPTLSISFLFVRRGS